MVLGWRNGREQRITMTHTTVDGLNSFELAERQAALAALQSAGGPLPETGPYFNLHCHTFYSYNGYGLSPTALAWRGRQEGLYAMGIVDFDVLDGVDEFLDGCAAVGLRGCAGMETRVYIPEFSDRVINSPGEPGISYHMGAGFVRTAAEDEATLNHLRAIAAVRNRGLLERVNGFLDPVVLDYERDLLPLTPSGNATERHVCQAYDEKAKAQFPDRAKRVAFWADRLGTDKAAIEKILDDGPALQGLIRSKTMKAGGVGYVQPNGPDFPKLETINAFTKANGALPTMTWLDGTTPGEMALDELLEVMMGSGVVMVNIVPDRNWNLADGAQRAVKVAAMDTFIAAAVARDLPIMVGTEMNAHGQRFVDDFEAAPMKPHYAVFRQGADVLSGHTALELAGGMGYLSPWAEAHFPSRRLRNNFYEEVGCALRPGRGLEGVGAGLSPEEVLGILGVEGT